MNSRRTMGSKPNVGSSSKSKSGSGQMAAINATRMTSMTASFSHTTVFATLITGGMPMVRETINGTFRQTNLPKESEEYLSKREELRRAEIELMNQRERVAELRRRLPKGPAVEDYVFEEVTMKLDEGDKPVRTVRLSQLFTGPDRSVVIYQFMYGKKQM